VNPAGQIGAEPVPPGQEFTYTVRSQGRLTSVEEFGDVVVRANADGSLIRVRDVARIELGSQTYQMEGRLNGKASAIIAVYQLPGSNAIQTMDEATALMEQLSERFPEDVEYATSLDTTLAVRAGMREIVVTLFQALSLVILVVYIFLQGVRATLIPALAVPVSLVGTFVFFPMLGFSINTLSLFGLVLAIGIVVDDAIVVVEAVEHNIEQGMSSKDAALRAMEQVTGPIVATTLILVAVFVPTAFIPGITGRMFQQFALTISVSVVISSFNALTLSPALSALLLRPRTPVRGPLGSFFRGFNRVFDRFTNGYVDYCRFFIRRSGLSMGVLVGAAVLGGWLGGGLPQSFIPDEDQGYFYMNVQLPEAASLQRTGEVCARIEEILAEIPGIQTYNTVVGYSLLSTATTTYNGFFFVTLEPWDEREGLTADVIIDRINLRLRELPEAVAFAFPPPAIPGVGTSGGVTFVLQDRSGQDVAFLAEQTNRFMEAATERPEIARVNTTLLPAVPQVFAHVDRDKSLKQGVALESVYQTLQAFMGGTFVNYFNRFGRVWQVYVQAEGDFRTRAENVGQFYVLNSEGQQVPLATLVRMEPTYGPEFTMRYNQYRSAQIMASAAPGYSSGQAMAAMEQVFEESMPSGMGYGYMGMSYQEKVASEGISPMVIFAFSLLMVFLILAAQYESWSLPFSVLLGTPLAVFGAFLGLRLRAFDNDVYAQIGLVMLIGLAAKNAILIVEFARAEVEGGKGVMEAALDAARLRLRPILMTAFSFILGVLPLVLASGSGAVSRQELGTAVMSGMGVATALAIFLVPVSFFVVERLSRRGEPEAAPSPPEEGGA
jgi:HAE1 family hydrophobic/amphiphilic exporter-1